MASSKKGSKSNAKSNNKKNNGNGTKCPAGKIRRNAASVKGFTRANGVKVAATNRKASCVTDQGAPGEGNKVIKIPNANKDLLMKYGYSTSLDDEKRHECLRKAAREIGHVRVIRYLNGLANLQMRTSPRISAILRADQKYVSSLHEKAKNA